MIGRVYPAKLTLTADAPGFTITFRDVPEATERAGSVDEAEIMALDALTSALGKYIESARRIPQPSTCRAGEFEVTLPLPVAARLTLYAAMREAELDPEALAHRLNTSPAAIHDLLDLDTSFHAEAVEAALRSLGLRLSLTVERI